MKKLLLVIVCFSFTSALFAQENSEPSFKLPRTLLKISPFQFVLQTFELGIERFNPTYSKSFEITAGIRTGSNNYENGLGGNLELAYRKYVAPMKFKSRNNHDSYQGIYYSLFIRGEYFKGEDSYYGNYPDNYSETSYSIAPGFTIGYQMTLWHNIVLDAFVGGGVKFSKINYYPSQQTSESYYDIFDPGYSGVFPKIGAKIGIGL